MADARSDAAGAAADARPGDAAVPDVAPEAPAPPPPMLDTQILRPGDDKTIHHLDCAINQSGQFIALWRQTDGDHKHQVWSTQVEHGARAWPLQSLGGRAATEVDRLAVTIDEQRRPVAVWNEPDGPDAGVVAASYLPGSGWQATRRVGPGWVLSVAASSAGELTAFSLLEGTPPTLLRFSPGGDWRVDTAFTAPRPGFFFASPLGRGVLFWNERAPGAAADELQAREYTFGGPWAAPARLQEARPFDHPLPLINGALAADGSGVVVWNRGGERQGQLWASFTRGPGQWEAPQLLADGEAALWTTTVLVKDGGDALVQWETGMPPRRKVWVALRAGGQWRPSTLLGDTSELVTAALGPTGSGAAVVAWSTPRRVYARHHRAAAGWGPPLEATGENGGVADLCAGIDSQGRGWVIWVNGGPQVLRAAAVGE